MLKYRDSEGLELTIGIIPYRNKQDSRTTYADT